MKNKNNKVKVTIGGWFTQVLAIVFITLKLTHYIDWSWWWVTAPIWGPLAFVLILLLLFVIICGILSLFIKLFKL